jgi:pseudouridine-5'-phosphate glycosidase
MSGLPLNNVVNRAPRPCVALESTLLLHGVPAASTRSLYADLQKSAFEANANAALIGVVDGVPIAGISDDEFEHLLNLPDVPKANTANLGILLHQRRSAATTVSTTMEIAAAAGIRVFATGGLGGVHRGYGEQLDISADLGAFTRFPVAVVCSGVKSILDVESTREALETLGVPVVGWRTDTFPAFYRRHSGAGVDARLEDIDRLASFVTCELRRTSRGIVIANPIENDAEIDSESWHRWLQEASQRAADGGVTGRMVTPFVLGALHEISGGRTLAANIALVRSNVRLGAALARALRENHHL